MQLLSNPTISPPTPCPYLDDRQFSQEYFFASSLSEVEIDQFLSTGWRKFGAYFFRPSCTNCWQCLPLRVPLESFSLNKKQRKLIRVNSDLKVEITPLEFKEEYFELFSMHSKERFSQTNKEIGSIEEFKDTFFINSCPSFVINYKLQDKLIAWGIVDQGRESLSSVYFVFNPKYSKRSLGHFSVLKEIEYAKEKNLNYYYLGYYVPGNSTMEYKSKYQPNQTYDWKKKSWSDYLK